MEKSLPFGGEFLKQRNILFILIGIYENKYILYFWDTIKKIDNIKIWPI